jgi:FixJ family two-component response regulator
MALVVSGLLNKQVGGELGISEITVKKHRGQVMGKMNRIDHPLSLARDLEPIPCNPTTDQTRLSSFTVSG